MKEKINQFIDRISEFLAYRKGLLPFIGILFISINWILQILPTANWLIRSDIFLHLGTIIAVIGLMVAWAL